MRTNLIASQPEHMLWILKRTISVREELLFIYFSVPNHLLLVSSADNLCKQFGPKSAQKTSGLIWIQSI